MRMFIVDASVDTATQVKGLIHHHFHLYTRDHRYILDIEGTRRLPYPSRTKTYSYHVSSRNVKPKPNVLHVVPLLFLLIPYLALARPTESLPRS